MARARSAVRVAAEQGRKKARAVEEAKVIDD